MNAWVMIVGTGITALAAWYVLSPLLQTAEKVRSSEITPDDERRYWETLQTIIDLESDYETGKLSKRDFETTVGSLKMKAARILMALKENQGE